MLRPLLRRRHVFHVTRDCRGRDRVEANHTARRLNIDRAECFRCALLMAKARISTQEVIHLCITAIKCMPVVRFRNDFLSPERRFHRNSGNAAITDRNFALGLGGCSSSSRMCVRSCSVNRRTSSAWITASASRRAIWGSCPLGWCRSAGPRQGPRFGQADTADSLRTGSSLKEASDSRLM